MARTLASMRTEVRRRSDMEADDSFVTDAEVDAFIAASARALVRKLASYGLPASTFSGVATQTTALVSGQATYFTLEPAYVVAVDVDHGLGYRPVRRLPHGERGGHDLLTSWRGSPLRYTIVDQGAGSTSVELDPAPTEAGTLRVRYVAAVTITGSGAEFWDNQGLDEWIVCDAAMKCLEKEGSDTSALRARRDEITDDLRAIGDMDGNEPPKIADVSPGLDPEDLPWIR